MCLQGEGSHFAHCSLPLALSGKGVGWAPLALGRWALLPLRGSLKVLLSSGGTASVPAALGKCWDREQHPPFSSRSPQPSAWVW